MNGQKGDRTTAVWQNGGFSAKFNGSSSIELLCKTEHLSFDFRHFAKLQNVVRNIIAATFKQNLCDFFNSELTFCWLNSEFESTFGKITALRIAA